MRGYLVVANQTLRAAELREELGEKISAGPCSFVVIVPDTTAAGYDPVAAGGALPHPGMWWWAASYARPATGEGATARARQRLRLMLAGLAGMGAPVEGELGSSSPLEAMGKVLAEHQFDEIIVATLPRRVSRWPRGRPAASGRPPVRAAGHGHHHRSLTTPAGQPPGLATGRECARRAHRSGRHQGSPCRPGASGRPATTRRDAFPAAGPPAWQRRAPPAGPVPCYAG